MLFRSDPETEALENGIPKDAAPKKPAIRLISFASMDNVLAASRLLGNMYFGANTLCFHHLSIIIVPIAVFSQKKAIPAAFLYRSIYKDYLLYLFLSCQMPECHTHYYTESYYA